MIHEKKSKDKKNENEKKRVKKKRGLGTIEKRG